MKTTRRNEKRGDGQKDNCKQISDSERFQHSRERGKDMVGQVFRAVPKSCSEKKTKSASDGRETKGNQSNVHLVSG